MSIYTPKIDISQFGNTKKVRAENANGEIQLLIEKGLLIQESPSEKHLERPSIELMNN
jgi:hypothetical protein